MNPFDFLAQEMQSDDTRVNHLMALRLLLPYWADEWDENPMAYTNGFQVILDKLLTLPASTLRSQIQEYLTRLVDTRGFAGFGPSY